MHCTEEHMRHSAVGTLLVVQAFKGECDWSINPIILDIKALASLFYSLDFCIPRTLYGQRHIVAQDVGWERDFVLLLARVGVLFSMFPLLMLVFFVFLSCFSSFVMKF